MADIFLDAISLLWKAINLVQIYIAFWALWNFYFSRGPVGVICALFLRQGQTMSNKDWSVLIIPRWWWFGIIFPSVSAAQQCSSGNARTSICVILVSIGIPYAYWMLGTLYRFHNAMHDNYLLELYPFDNDSDADYSTSFEESSDDAESSEDDIEALHNNSRTSINWESRLILKAVVEVPSDHSTATNTQSSTMSSSRHSKTDIAIHVNNVNKNCSSFTGTALFPIGIPDTTYYDNSLNSCESEAVLPRDIENQEFDETDTKADEDTVAAATTAAVDENEDQHLKVCSICSKEYVVGDDIAWSKNDQCHHVFHKDCIVKLLDEGHTKNCPICRLGF
jgi:hypothetical protein